MRRFFLVHAFVFGSVRLLCSQSLSGPVEGFTFDGPTECLRAVNGVPGAATLGPAVLSEVEFGTVAPHLTYGIVFKNRTAMFVSKLGSSHVSTTPLAGVFGQPEAAVWSGDGSEVVLFSRSGKWLQTISGLPGSPKVNQHQDLSVLSGLLCDVAIHAPGSEIAVAMCGRQAGAYLSTPGQSFTPLPRMENPIALDFSADGTELYVIDAGARKLIAIRLSNSTSEEFVVHGLATPFAIRAVVDSSNKTLLYIASRSDRLLGIYSPSLQKMEKTIRLSFEPTGIQGLGLASFVVASRVAPGDPLWLFTTVPQPAVFFVPAWQANLRGVE